MGPEVNVCALIRQAPYQEGTTLDRMLEPAVELRGDVAVQEDLDGLFLLARELPNLQRAHVRRRFPIDVARAFQRFVWADAIEVAAQPAVVRFDLAGDSRQEVVEA